MMWASLALVLALGLSAVTSQGLSETTPKKLELPDKLFVPYHKYTYNYTVEALTSIPHESKTITGIRISCSLDVTIEPNEDVSRSDSLRLRNCDVSVVNKDLLKMFSERADSLPFIMLPEDAFQSVDSIVSVSETMKTHLHKPISFEYIRGAIGEIKTYEDDPIWSVNIKKGILSVLKAFTTTRKEIDTIAESASLRDSDKSRPEADDYLSYRMFEKDAIGRCESSYAWSSLENPFIETISSGKSAWLEDTATVLRVMNLTKSRNYDNCSSDPFVVQSNMPFDETPFYAEQGKAVVNSSAHIDYSIVIVSPTSTDRYPSSPTSSSESETDGKPIVERIFARSQHVFAPFGYKFGYLSASTHQMLELCSYSRVETSEPLTRYTKATDIEMEQPKMSELAADRADGDLTSTKSKIHSLLVELLTMFSSSRREHIGSLFISLIDEMKKLDLEGLKSVFESINQLYGARRVPSTVASDESVRYFLIDLLPSIGSKHSVRLMKKYLQDEMYAERVLSVISNLNFLMPPHPSILPEVAKICDEPEMKVERGRCTKVARLAYGSLVFNLFSDWRSTPSAPKPRCTVFVGSHAECGLAFASAGSILKRWLREGLQSKKENETIAALEAISNSGHHGCFDEVKKILEDDSAMLSIKIAAGYSLRKMVHTSKKESVRRILFPIMRDPSLEVEIRVMAYTILIEGGHRDESLFEHLAHILSYDRSSYFVNYVYSHLHSLSKTDIPKLRSFANRIKTMLAGVRKPESEHYPMNRLTHFPFYSEDVEVGGSVNFASVGTPKSFLPRAVDMQINAYIFGKRVNLFEVVGRVEGLQEILDKFIGPGPGILSAKKWSSIIKDFERPTSSRTESTGRDDESEYEGEGRTTAATGAEAEAEPEEASKKPASPKREPFVAHLMLKIFGKHVSFAFINAHSIVRALFGRVDNLGRTTEEPMDWMKLEQKLSNGIESNLLKNYVLYARAALPTPAGIPLYLNTTIGIKIHAEKFKITAGLEPSIFSERSSEDERRESAEERRRPSTSGEDESEESASDIVRGRERRSDGMRGQSRRDAVFWYKIKKLEKFCETWRSEPMKRKFTLHIEGNPRFYAIAHSTFGFDLHEISTMTGLHADVRSDFSKETLSTDLHFDTKKGVLTWSVDLPKGHSVALNASVSPFGSVVVPVGSSAYHGKYSVHTVDVENSMTETMNSSYFRYFRRNEELNVTSTMTKTPCSDGRSGWSVLPTYVFCGKQGFEVVLHGRRNSEKIQITTKLSTNITIDSDGHLYRYPLSPSKSLIESDSPSASVTPFTSGAARSWKVSVSASLETKTSRSGDRPLLRMDGQVNLNKLLKQKNFDAHFKVEHDLANECMDHECRLASGTRRPRTSPWSAAVSATGKYFAPSIDHLPAYTIKKQPAHYSIDNTLGTNFTICFGEWDCDRADGSEKRVNVFVGFKKSEKQKSLERLWWTYVNKPINHPNMTSMMRSCKEELSKGYTHADACYRLWLSFLQFNKLDAQIDWSEVSTDSSVRKTLYMAGYKLMTSIRNWLYDKWVPYYDMTYSSPDSVSSDVCRFSIERDPETYTIDLEMRSEHSRHSLASGHVDKFEKLSPMMPVCVPSAYTSFWKSCAMDRLKHDPTNCYVRHDHVSTFDGKTYFVPVISEADREFIVAKDASPKTRFEVTVKNVDATHKRVNLTLSDFIVSVKPEYTKDGSRSDVKVIVINKLTGDTKEYTVTKDDEISITDRHDKLVLLMTRKLESRVSIYAVRDGVSVHADGYSADVQVSPFYYNLLCGLCGSYNADKWDDFIGLAGEVYAEPYAFVSQYSVSPIESAQTYNSAERRGCRETVSVSVKTEGSIEYFCIGKSTKTICESPCSTKKKISHICVDKASETYDSLVREYGNGEIDDSNLPVSKLPEIIRKLSSEDNYVSKIKRIDVNSC